MTLSIVRTSLMPTGPVRPPQDLAAILKVTEEAGDASAAAKTATTPAVDGSGVDEGRDTAAWPRRTDGEGPRREVDRRTVDSEMVRVTVISYSDGSSESLTLQKFGKEAAELPKTEDLTYSNGPLANATAEKGLLVNQTA